ncbi:MULTISPECIES: twin transmembrane helix small protein [unclassified Sphingosinithalassobacter]|uniref:twin transmembrane helix small protein n=1 Tax=unclassified Sphingosinithalassobacter TaxID=2676235 RepID=UPI00165D6B92|nr:twin transmembrane helix small protein [Sphingosinithalassobacter sp. CS137]
MNLFLVLLLIAAMIATVVALVRGIVAFIRTTEADLNGTGPSASSMRSNKMMQARVLFQGVAVVIVALLLLLAGRG